MLTCAGQFLKYLLVLDNAGQQESRSSGEGLVDFERGTMGIPAVNNTVLLNKAKPNEKLLYI